MKKTILAFALMTAIACSISDEGSNEKEIVHTKEPSELAQLMRLMEEHGDAVKLALQNNTDLPEIPEGIESLTTAIPTEGMHIDEKRYPIFAKDYLVKVEALQKAQQDNRHSAYNDLVQSCENCHNSHCPGPLIKIEKMYLTMEN